MRYLFGYASSLYSLAQEVLAFGLKAPDLEMVISNAEPLYAHQRSLISRVFGCPVRETYGMCEIVTGASECTSGSLHLWPDVGVCEILEETCDRHALPGATGRIVATGLLNSAMPLVRYEVGDRASASTSDVPCPCGRSLPRLQSVEGRLDDVLRTPGGRRIGRMDPVFKGEFRIRESQIVQEALDRVRVDVVPAPGFGSRDVQQLADAMRDRLGEEVVVTIRAVAEIPRGANGKFRAVVSLIGGARRDSPDEPTPVGSSADRSSNVSG